MFADIPQIKILSSFMCVYFFLSWTLHLLLIFSEVRPSYTFDMQTDRVPPHFVGNGWCEL